MTTAPCWHNMPWSCCWSGRSRTNSCRVLLNFIAICILCRDAEAVSTALWPSGLRRTYENRSKIACSMRLQRHFPYPKIKNNQASGPPSKLFRGNLIMRARVRERYLPFLFNSQSLSLQTSTDVIITTLASVRIRQAAPFK